MMMMRMMRRMLRDVYMASLYYDGIEVWKRMEWVMRCTLWCRYMLIKKVRCWLLSSLFS